MELDLFETEVLERIIFFHFAMLHDLLHQVALFVLKRSFFQIEDLLLIETSLLFLFELVRGNFLGLLSFLGCFFSLDEAFLERAFCLLEFGCNLALHPLVSLLILRFPLDGAGGQLFLGDLQLIV